MPDTPLLPSRLHHGAWTTRDMARTRAFYEEVIGLPLLATWCEADRLFGKVRTYVHCFFGLADGSALAFFQFADAAELEIPRPRRAGCPVEVRHQRQQVLQGGQALVVEQDGRVLEHGGLPLGVVHEIGGQEAAVELQAT